uniref:Uncharacterized protein n=1 Tax=Rhizophora mucronata TaxID=61149 RepID=A0A2P2QHV8_RHIMU
MKVNVDQQNITGVELAMKYCMQCKLISSIKHNEKISRVQILLKFEKIGD